MGWVPRASDDFVSVAWARPSTVAMPRIADASLNVTGPVGVPPPMAFTVAVKVTGWPTSTGFADDVNVVHVGEPAASAGATHATPTAIANAVGANRRETRIRGRRTEPCRMMFLTGKVTPV